MRLEDVIVEGSFIESEILVLSRVRQLFSLSEATLILTILMLKGKQLTQADLVLFPNNLSSG